MSIENYIQESKEILQSEFNFKPEQSIVKYHNPDTWNNRIKKKDKNIKGLFQPRTLTAHISKDPKQTLLTRIIHEYLGHGSYCEYAKNGKRIVKFEQDLKNLEEKLIGKKLQDNLKIAIKKSKKTSLRKSKDSYFDYILYVSKENPLLSTYLTLQEQYKQFFQENLLTYEGFAVWLEEFLLKRLKQEKIWGIRKNEIKNTSYQQFYQEFKKFEQEKGLLSLIYRVGFPKQFDKKSVIKVVNEHLDTNELSFLILYGSKRKYGDIDLLAINKEGRARERVYTEDLDIIQVTEDDFIERIGLFDIELTEPLLTGEIIIGNENRLEKLKKQLFKQKFSEKASNHLKRKSLEAYNYAIYCYNQGVYEETHRLLTSTENDDLIKKLIKEETDLISGQFLYALHNLSYVWSYSLANDLYQNNSKPLRLNEILKETNNQMLQQIISYAREIKRDLDIPKKNKTKELLDKTRDYLISSL